MSAGLFRGPAAPPPHPNNCPQVYQPCYLHTWRARVGIDRRIIRRSSVTNAAIFSLWKTDNRKLHADAHLSALAECFLAVSSLYTIFAKAVLISRLATVRPCMSPDNSLYKL